MGTGFSATTLSDDTLLKKYEPDLYRHLAPGWTDASVSRGLAFTLVQADLIASPLIENHKSEYLARIADNTPLQTLEAFKALQLFYEARTQNPADIFAYKAEHYRKLYQAFFKGLQLQFDRTVAVTETDEDDQPEQPHAVILRA